MRTTTLQRFVTGFAAFGLGAGVLAVTPATADPAASAITRAQVLEAATIARKPELERTGAETAVLIGLMKTACSIPAGQPYIQLHPMSRIRVVPAGNAADGFVVSAQRMSYNPDNPVVLDDYMNCTVALIASTSATRTLSGSVTVEAVDVPRQSFVLSGNVFVSPQLGTKATRPEWGFMQAIGHADGPPQKITTAKTLAQKKAARKAYDTSLAAAKKTYKKALKKAGKSKSKKVAAKRKYNARKVSAANKYRAAIAPTTKWAADRIPFDFFVNQVS